MFSRRNCRLRAVFKEGAALRGKRRIPHVDLLIGAKPVVVESALGGALHEGFEVGLHDVVACLDVGEVLGEGAAFSLDTADALGVFAYGNDAGKALIFEIMLAI